MLIWFCRSGVLKQIANASIWVLFFPGEWAECCSNLFVFTAFFLNLIASPQIAQGEKKLIKTSELHSAEEAVSTLRPWQLVAFASLWVFSLSYHFQFL